MCTKSINNMQFNGSTIKFSKYVVMLILLKEVVVKLCPNFIFYLVWPIFFRVYVNLSWNQELLVKTSYQ